MQSSSDCQHSLGSESLLYHFTAAFLNQAFQYVAFHPHGKYRTPKVLLTDCKFIIPPTFQGTSSQLSHLMKQYFTGSSSAASEGTIQATYERVALWNPISPEYQKKTFAFQDKLFLFAGCCQTLEINGTPTLPDNTHVPTPITILQVRYLHHLMKESGSGSLPTHQFWNDPMSTTSNFQFRELYRNTPSRSTLLKSVQRWMSKPAYEHNPSLLPWIPSPSPSSIHAAEDNLRDPQLFWTVLKSCLTPRTAIAWRFVRLYYDKTVEVPRSYNKDARVAWSQQCAIEAVSLLFPSVPPTVESPDHTPEDSNSTT